jgi:hypothetical protein
MNKPKLLISFSGGRTSAFMTQLLLREYKEQYEMIVVFANTGKEREETLQFIQQCDDVLGFNTVWIEGITGTEFGAGHGIRAKVVNNATASRNGEPFELLFKKFGICNVRTPFCTIELKRATIKNYARQIGWRGYFTAIGIRADEFDRISPRAVKERYIYPLIKAGTVKADINRFWLAAPFDLKLKGYEGNCDLCFKKSLRKLLTSIKERPEAVDWWQAMEKKYEYFVPEHKKHNLNIKLPIHFFRNNMSIAELVELAKQPFNKAEDDSKTVPETDKQLLLFDLDTSNGCSESCEVF